MHAIKSRRKKVYEKYIAKQSRRKWKLSYSTCDGHQSCDWH